MWRFLSALFLAPIALAQPDPLAGYYAELLAEYLKLSTEQAEQLSRNSQEFEAATTAQRKEVNRLNGEIGKEMQKPDPAPPVLGPLYAQIEDLCRREQIPSMNLHQRQIQVRTAEQSTLLNELEGSPVIRRRLDLARRGKPRQARRIRRGTSIELAGGSVRGVLTALSGGRMPALFAAWLEHHAYLR